MLNTKSLLTLMALVGLFMPITAVAIESCEKDGEVIFTQECLQAILEKEKKQKAKTVQSAPEKAPIKLPEPQQNGNNANLISEKKDNSSDAKETPKNKHQLPLAEEAPMSAQQPLEKAPASPSVIKAPLPDTSETAVSTTPTLRSKERVLVETIKPETSRSLCKGMEFITAAESGDLNFIQACKPDRALLEATDIRDYSRGRTALHWAVHNNHLTVVKFLLDSGAPLNAKSRSDFGGAPIHVAAKNGQTLHVKLLLQNGSSVAASNLLKQTPLHLAAKKGHIETIRFLLEKGASANSLDRVGKTPLIAASRSNSGEVITFLVKQGSDINHKTVSGMTALHYAAEHSNKITSFLIAQGAQLDPVNNEGETPLSGLVRKGIDRHWPRIQLLIKAGAKLDQQDMKGQSILDLSLTRNHLALFNLLLEKGVDTNQLFLQQLKNKPEFIKALQKHSVL